MVHLLLAIIYLVFVSLGMRDSLLGAAWPSIYTELGIPVSYEGILSMIIYIGVVASSLMSDRFTRKMGRGRFTVFNVIMITVALYGFSVSSSFWMLCLWAVPYGLGAGGIDASLNNYVAIHYTSRHMNWLHCMWGVGASIGPYIISSALSQGRGWGMGYRYGAIFQVGLTMILIFSLPLWRDEKEKLVETGELEKAEKKGKPFSPWQILSLPGAKAVMLTYFCYSAIEHTVNLWASSYLVQAGGVSVEAAAGVSSMFFMGITVGRAFGGVLSMKWSDFSMIRLGQGIILLGVLLLLLPFGGNMVYVGLVMIGLGCAPTYPCMIHMTPARFGRERSQAAVGVQTAAAYVGNCLMPPLFGVMANHFGLKLFPVYLLVMLLLMIFMNERVNGKGLAKTGSK